MCPIDKLKSLKNKLKQIENSIQFPLNLSTPETRNIIENTFRDAQEIFDSCRGELASEEVQEITTRINSISDVITQTANH